MDNPTKLAMVSKVVSVLNTTQNDHGKVGLNVYQIYPEKLIYPLSGFSNVTQANTMIGAAGPYFNVTGFYAGPGNFIINNILSGGANPPNPKCVDIDYVRGNGDREIIYNRPLSASSLYGYNINRITWSDTSINDGMSLSEQALSVYISGYENLYRNSINNFSCGSALITVPNGYRGIVTDLYFYMSTPGDIRMYVKDRLNNIKTVQYFANQAKYDYKYNYVGALNYPLDPIDTVYFGAVDNNIGNCFVHANVVLMAF